MRLVVVALLVASPVAAQEALSIAPGHTLRFHAAPRAESPVSRAYSLDLAAGDWLAVSAPAAIIAGAATEPPIRIDGPAATTASDHGRLVFRAPADGVYRLSLRDFHALSVSRYPAGHPLVDPGLAPADIRLNAAPLRATPRFAVEPLDLRHDDAPPPSGWPARLTITIGDAMTIHLYRRDALRQMELWPADPTPVLAGLLRGQDPIEARPDLPLFPAGNVSVAFAAQAERRRGPCIDWLRHVARWTQEAAWPFESLTYVALGLSRDGRYFATATAEAVPVPLPGQPAAPREGVSPAYEAALRRRIATDPAALTPRLAVLDAVLESLVIPCAAP